MALSSKKRQREDASIGETEGVPFMLLSEENTTGPVTGLHERRSMLRTKSVNRSRKRRCCRCTLVPEGGTQVHVLGSTF